MLIIIEYIQSIYNVEKSIKITKKGTNKSSFKVYIQDNHNNSRYSNNSPICLSFITMRCMYPAFKMGPELYNYYSSVIVKL